MLEGDVRNGMGQLVGGPLLAKLRYLPQLLAHPQWLAAFLVHGGLPVLPNIVVPGRGPMELVDVNTALGHTPITWADLPWVRALRARPVVIKGVLTGEDARRAV